MLSKRAYIRQALEKTQPFVNLLNHAQCIHHKYFKMHVSFLFDITYVFFVVSVYGEYIVTHQFFKNVHQ